MLFCSKERKGFRKGKLTIVTEEHDCLKGHMGTNVFTPLNLSMKNNLIVNPMKTKFILLF